MHTGRHGEQDEARSDGEQAVASDVNPAENDGYPVAEDGQQYVDRSKIDFDPDDGLYTGTVVDGDPSDVPGPHEGDDLQKFAAEHPVRDDHPGTDEDHTTDGD